MESMESIRIKSVFAIANGDDEKTGTITSVDTLNDKRIDGEFELW